MGEGYYFIQRGDNGEIERVVTSHSLGGGYKLGEFWAEDTITPLKEFLISTFGKGWKLEGEYGLDESEERALEERIPNVGYSEKVREFCVSTNLTSWGAIEMFDKIIITCEDGDKVPADRHVMYNNT